MATMKKLITSALILSALIGCATFANAVPFLPTPSQGDCIWTDVDKGMPALDIVKDCKLEENAIAFVEALIAGKSHQARRLAHERFDSGAP